MNVELRSRLVVALDVPSFDEARALLKRLRGLEVVFKVGYESLYAYGDQIRAELERRAAPAFIDAKLHDIPRTVAAGMRALVRPGVEIVTVHAQGGNDMMASAVESAAQRARELGIAAPKVFAVTVLTSIAPEELPELGLQGGPGENVMRLAALARDARCNGVVCSPQEARDVKRYFGAGFEVLTGGIRPVGASHDDQKRVSTPTAAVEAGADYLVVGRPITEAADPAEAARSILAEMERARA